MKQPRHIMLTGASGGIGAAIADRLAAPGTHLILHYHRNRDVAKALAGKLAAAGASASLVGGDLSSESGRQEVVDQALAVAPRVDVLINNAGGPIKALPMGEITEPDAAAVMGLNFLGALFLCQAYFPRMCAQGGGRIVNISSIGVKFGGGSTTLVYSAAKHALESLTLNLARQGAAHGVLVNTVRAGVVDTALFDRAPKDMEQRRQLIPLKRFAQPGEIAAMVAYLAGEDATFITGQTFAVSGGE